MSQMMDSGEVEAQLIEGVPQLRAWLMFLCTEGWCSFALKVLMALECEELWKIGRENALQEMKIFDGMQKMQNEVSTCVSI